LFQARAIRRRHGDVHLEIDPLNRRLVPVDLHLA